MKTTKLFLVSCIAYLLFVSCKEWEVPTTLIGKWESKQTVKVRTKENGKYVFISAPDSIVFQFEIDGNGNVSGHLGDAIFENCKVSKNRGNLGRTLNLATDYVIKGNLNGAIFSSDPHLTKEISAPFDIKNNKMEGSFFQMVGLDLYPVTGMDASKKE
jgi:hypothetical protein